MRLATSCFEDVVATSRLVRHPKAADDPDLHAAWALAAGTAALGAAITLRPAFAPPFAPDFLHEAVAPWRREFQPSGGLDRRRVGVGVNAASADPDAEERRLFTSVQPALRNLVRGTLGPLPPPVGSMDGRWTPAERAEVGRRTAVSAVGSPDAVRGGLEATPASTGADELILAGQGYDLAARLRSFELIGRPRGPD